MNLYGLGTNTVFLESPRPTLVRKKRNIRHKQPRTIYEFTLMQYFSDPPYCHICMVFCISVISGEFKSVGKENVRGSIVVSGVDNLGRLFPDSLFRGATS